MCTDGFDRIRTRAYLFVGLVGPACSFKAINILLTGKMSLALGHAATAEPGARLVANEFVVDVWFVAHLVPAKVAAIAEDDLVSGDAQSSSTHFAQGLLCRTLAVVLALLGGGIAG